MDSTDAMFRIHPAPFSFIATTYITNNNVNINENDYNTYNNIEIDGNIKHNNDNKNAPCQVVHCEPALLNRAGSIAGLKALLSWMLC